MGDNMKAKIEEQIAIDIDYETFTTDEIIKNLSIRMTRNVVSNEAEQIQNALQLSTLISKESVLGLLQEFIPDVAVELERLAEEREESISFMQDNFNGMHSDKEQPQEVEEESVDDTDE